MDTATVFPLKKAATITRKLNKTEEDGWLYKTVNFGNGLAQIAVYDEKREYVGVL